ncbi:MAG: redox-regulated ATPase YchF [Planctomycetes bacterium]|nr:redox-regulated ATPase YchF [Planctomycetota bacterium]
MKMGLVGYAGTGKSTVFEWLTGEKPDPSKVQQGQTAMADVPDDRLAKIASIIKPKKTTYTKVAVLDTPGLMVGEQKDNARRLGVIREANGMVIVLDGFSRTDFAVQLAKFREELLFADLEVVSNRIPKVEAGLKKAKPAKEREADEAELALLKRVVAAFESGKPASALGLTADEEKALRSFQLLTLKPEIAFVNRGDSGFNDPLPADLLALEPHAVQAPVKLEAELLALPDEDRTTFMADMGVTEFRRAATIRAMFYGVGREVFFTVGEDECRTWSIPKGCEAVEAAGCIHKDLSERFVRANVIGFNDFVACGYSEKEAKTKGLNRTEGKTYIVKDADILHILASS